MDFFDSVKQELLRKKEASISKIDDRINQLQEQLQEKANSVSAVSNETDGIKSRKSEMESNTMSEKELDDLQVLYNFLSNYPKIVRITNLLRGMGSGSSSYVVYIYDDATDEERYQAQIEVRNEYRRSLASLNKGILEICEDSRQEEEIQKDIDVLVQNKEPKTQRGFFNNFFNKALGLSDSKKSQPNPKKNNVDSMEKYKETITRFNKYGREFLRINGGEIITRVECTKTYSIINMLKNARAGTLSPKDEKFLRDNMPIELWEELLRYFEIIEPIKMIVDRFGDRFDKYLQLSQSNPDLFDLDSLRGVIEKNSINVIDLRSIRKELTNQKRVLTQKRQDAKEVRNELNTCLRKREELLKEKGKIERAKTLKELGYNSKQEAADDLGIDLKEYIVIPVQSNISSYSELFNTEKVVRIGYEGRSFEVEYSTDVAYGMINSMDNSETVNMVLLIPINSLKKEDIDSVKAGRIGLNSSVTDLESIIAIKSKSRKFDFEGGKVQVVTPEQEKLFEYVKSYLGNDFVVDYKKEVSNYSLFKKVSDVSSKEKKARKEAIKRGLVENVSEEFSAKNKVLVNGKPFFLTSDDEKDMTYISRAQAMDESKIEDIAERIQLLLMDDSASSFNIDKLYGELLKEYLRIHPKARADYYNEENTTIKIDGIKYSIKPALSPKREEMAKRYTRTSEDKAFKLMKLAKLVNRFAHLTQNEELAKTLFNVKTDLMEEVIDLSEKNPNIKIRQRFDEDGMLKSVIAEIPGYELIALHVRNATTPMMSKVNKLEKYANGEVIPQKTMTTIQAPGVNRELLLKMKKMNIEERIKLLLSIDDNTFYKLMLRMGYDSESVNSVSDRSIFIRKAISDDRIDELIKESKELDGDYTL